MMNPQEIREKMKVVGADRQPVGTVDRIENDRIKLMKNDPQAKGKHHYIPADWVESVEGDEVCLSKNAKDTFQQWLDS